MTVRILQGDVRDVLATLPDESVHCVVTSPPYWGLRDYGVAGQIGMEPTMGEHIDTMVDVFREVRRVLRKDGTVWLNYGDCYANDAKWGGSSGGKHVNALHGNTGIGRQKVTTGLKAKDLCMIPNRLAIALQDDGWWVRSEIIWAKPNPMPESVTDRPATAHEKLWLLSKAARYFYDAEAVRTEDRGTDHTRNVLHRPEPSGGIMSPHAGIRTADGRNGSGANLRNVWTIPTKGFSGAHFATFPPALVEPCIKAGTSEKGCCAECGAPWVRDVAGGARGFAERKRKQTTTTGWSPSCACDAATIPCTVLDPFMGSGTTALVADRLGRDCIGIELNPANVVMAHGRVLDDAGMFAEVAAQ